jgi:hypothetical protein
VNPTEFAAEGEGAVHGLHPDADTAPESGPDAPVDPAP